MLLRCPPASAAVVATAARSSESVCAYARSAWNAARPRLAVSQTAAARASAFTASRALRNTADASPAVARAPGPDASCPALDSPCACSVPSSAAPASTHAARHHAGVGRGAPEAAACASSDRSAAAAAAELCAAQSSPAAAQQLPQHSSGSVSLYTRRHQAAPGRQPRALQPCSACTASHTAEKLCCCWPWPCPRLPPVQQVSSAVMSAAGGRSRSCPRLHSISAASRGRGGASCSCAASSASSPPASAPLGVQRSLTSAHTMTASAWPRSARAAAAEAVFA